MLNLQASSHVDRRTMHFLEKHPIASKSLLAACDQDFDKVSTIVGPILDAPKRCLTTSYYLQAVLTGQSAFLTTNLLDLDETCVTDVAPTWLIGRSRNCGITIHNPTISRCHAVVGYDPKGGFYLMDVGSSNGTFVDGQRLKISERFSLVDGDLIKFSNIQVEFFIVTTPQLTENGLTAV
jgi:FHA domain